MTRWTFVLLGTLIACGNGGPTCDERVAEARERIEAIRTSNLSCTESSECVLFDPSTLCLGDCARPIAVSGLAEVERAVQELNETTCRNFTADGCAFATPACLRVEARCEQGVCVAVPVP